ncbi:hypothetical protein, partial [Stenotrophomonas maltophilia]|uniref:hypothetical protein n=1 Tax=Stenotrophomonas maltophilia TaxID=40324 RepID=UPI00209B3EFD
RPRAAKPVNVIAGRWPAPPQAGSESDYTPADAIEYVCRVIPAKNALPTIAATTAATASHVHGTAGTFTNRSATLPGRGKC